QEGTGNERGRLIPVCNGKAGVVDDLKRRAERGAGSRVPHDGGVLDIDEVVGLDIETLEGREVERLVLHERSADRATPLFVAIRRFLLVQRVPRRIEFLEIVL